MIPSRVYRSKHIFRLLSINGHVGFISNVFRNSNFTKNFNYETPFSSLSTFSNRFHSSNGNRFFKFRALINLNSTKSVTHSWKHKNCASFSFHSYNSSLTRYQKANESALKNGFRSFSTLNSDSGIEWNTLDTELTENSKRSTVSKIQPCFSKHTLNMDDVVDSMLSNPTSSSSSLSTSSSCTLSPLPTLTPFPSPSPSPSSSSPSDFVTVNSQDSKVQTANATSFYSKRGKFKMVNEISHLLSKANTCYDLEKVLSQYKESMDSRLINGVIRSQSDSKTVIDIYKWLKCHSVFQKDSTLFVSVLGNLYHCRKFAEMEMIMDDLINCSDESNDLIKLFDLHACKQLIKHCSYIGNSRLVFNVYERMIKSNIIPDVNVFSMLIDLCTETGNYSQGLYYNDEMRKMDNLPDTLLCNSLISFFGKLGHISKVKSIFDFMKSNQIVPNLQTFSKIIHCYAKHGDIENAKSYLNEMKHYHLSPNVIIYTSFLSAFIKSNDTASAEMVVKKMKEEGMVLDTVVYATLLNVYVHKGEKEKAEVLYNELLEKGIEMNRVMYNIMLILYLNEKDYPRVGEVMAEMKKKKVLDGIDTYSYLLWKVVECEEEKYMNGLFELLENSSFPLHHILSLVVGLVGEEEVDVERNETLEEKKVEGEGVWENEQDLELKLEGKEKWSVNREKEMLKEEEMKGLTIERQIGEGGGGGGGIIEMNMSKTSMNSKSEKEKIKEGRSKAIWNQVSVLLNTIRYEEYDKRKKYIDALISFLCKIDKEVVAAKIWIISMSKNIISHSIYNDSRSWILDLRSFNPTTATIALKCELILIRRYVIRGRRCAEEMEIITGRGFRESLDRKVRVRDTVRELLLAMKSPFDYHPSNGGRLFAFGDDVAKWLSKSQVARHLKF